MLCDIVGVKKTTHTILLVVGSLVGSSGVHAQTNGFVAVRLYQVRNVSHDDGACGHPDFFAMIKINGTAAIKTSVVDDQELAVWPDCGYTVSVPVPLTQQVVPIHIQVKEEDDTFCLDDDDMDINPAAGVRDLDFTVDTACLRVSGLPACSGRPGGSSSLLRLCARGDGSDGDGGAAEIIFDVIVDSRMEAPALPLACTPEIVSFGTDDVAVTSVSVIQVIENATKAVKQRQAVVRVGVSNTFLTPVDTDLTVSVNDGVRIRTESRSVHIEPGWQGFDFFESAPVLPRGSVNQPWVCANVALDAGGLLPPTKFDNCDSYDTDTMTACVPIVSTPAVNTVLIPYFYSTDIPLLPAKLNIVRRDSQKLMSATWPTRTVRTIASPIPVPASPLLPDLASPFSDLIVFGVLNRAVCGPLEPLVGPTKWVLEVPQGWFDDHAIDILGGGGIPAAIIGLFSDTTGITFPCLPYAALSSYGRQTTATHELGHLYGLSRGSCPIDLGDRILEALFCYTSCIDEYNYAPSGSGLPASGYDTRGTLYSPRGAIENAECFMGSSGDFDGGTKVWIHDGDFEWLTEKLIASPGPRATSPAAGTLSSSTKILISGVLSKPSKPGESPAFTPYPYYTVDGQVDTGHAPELSSLSGNYTNPVDARFVVRFLSSFGKELGRADAAYLPTDEAPSPLFVEADFPVSTAYIAVDDEKTKKRLHTRTVPATLPTVQFTGPASPVKKGAPYVATWKVSGGTKDPPSWSLFLASRKDALKGYGYVPVALQTKGSSVTVDTKNLSLGSYNLLLVGSDGVHTITQPSTSPLTIVSQ